MDASAATSLRPDPPSGRDRADLAGALALFLGSGMSGLAFEVIWVRSLALWVGHSTVAVSLVVAAFLAGIVIGSYLGGAWADRAARPLRLYAFLELAVGATALASSLAVAYLGKAQLTGALASNQGVRMAVAFALLLPPTIAMGATTPALARFVTKEISHVGRSFALLYAINTLGAALGCGLAGFVWIGRVGILRTALGAVAINAVVGTAALIWERVSIAHRSPSPEVPAPVQAKDTVGPLRDGDGAGAYALAAIAFVTGGASIACEVLWFRVLRTFVDSSTYAFTLLLVTFLLGLVAGGLLFAWRLGRHARPWQLLADLQSGLALTGLGSMVLLGDSGWVLGHIEAIVGHDSPMTKQALFVAVVIFVPTVFSGATYPLVMRLGTASLARVGRDVGILAAANTVGGALASLATGLWFIPRFGTQTGLALAFTLNLGIAVAVYWRTPLAWEGGARDGSWRRGILWPVVFVAAVWFVAPPDLIRRSLVYWTGGAKVLAVREGRDGTAIVDGVDRASVCAASTNHCREHCKTDFTYQQLTFGSMSYASTNPAGRRYMRALGHLPMLLHPSATRALEICFGTGTTAGAFATYPTLESLTIVDINRDVFDLAPFFRESNHDVLLDSRVHPIVEDGRHFLQTGTETFDVVSLEPPPPEADGAASLYTTEFYEHVKRRLGPGGVLAQWIPLQLQTDGLNRSLVRSMSDVFPNVSVFMPSRVEAVIVASDTPLHIDVASWDALMAIPTVHASLAEVALDTPEELLSTLVLDNAGVQRYVQGSLPVTDDLPAIEFFRSHPGAPFAVAQMLDLAIDPKTLVPSLGAARAARLDRETLAVRMQMQSWMAPNDGEAMALASKAVELVGDTNAYAARLRDVDVDCTAVQNP